MNLLLESYVTIDTKKIIGIFDIDDKVTPQITKEFLRKSEKSKKIKVVGYELPKSFILIDDDNQNVIFSHLSAKSLAGRAEEKITDILK